MAMNKTKLFTTIAAITSIVIVFYLFFLAASSTDSFDSEQAAYYYNIEVKGLDKYTSFGATDIIVPMPMKNGEQVFTDEELQYRPFGDWKSVLVGTKEGKMLAFQTVKNKLSNINASFKKYVNYSTAGSTLRDALLYPASNESSVNYTTYVYVDPKIQHELRNNNSIYFEITLYSVVEPAHGKRKVGHRVEVRENIPDAIRGPIQIKAYIIQEK